MNLNLNDCGSNSFQAEPAGLGWLGNARAFPAGQNWHLELSGAEVCAAAQPCSRPPSFLIYKLKSMSHKLLEVFLTHQLFR